MACSSGKVAYVTEVEARMALDWLRSPARPRNKRKRTVRHAYHCPECREWHLTSRGPMRLRPLSKKGRP